MTNKKYEKPIELNMSFDEAIQRLSSVKKTEVESKIKRVNSKKRKP
tara:strand:+ start:61037 stop:61174 length:138 start_codon:yes stop_codon:yes gene_type:complete